MISDNLYKYVATLVKSIISDKPKLIAVDGVDAAGKTIFANKLEEELLALGYSVVRASIDGFHNPREERYRLGSKSPEGYYRCSFDYEGLTHYLLKPLRYDVEKIYKTAIYDFRTENVINQDYKIADNDTFLIMEGVFMLRPEIYKYWDYKIFLHVDFEEVINRVKIRDKYLFGSPEEIEARYRGKYIKGQQLYLSEVEPYYNCDVVINNNDYNNPQIINSDIEIKRLHEKAINFK